jgi:Flp pilus assembly protein TadD
MLGLMAKPMLVTLPFVLLLIDYWPLERLRHESPFNLILEKIPFFALSAASVYISSLSTERFGMGLSEELVPMQLRIANALVSYVKYIEKTIWPKNLAIFYPFPDNLPVWQVFGACLFLASISFLVLLNLRKKPYLCIGWLWFLGTLIPVIGLKQAGLWPAMADRWAYVPLVGIFIIVTWGGSDLLKKWTNKKIVSSILAMSVLLVLTMQSFHQAAHWKNNITLFENAIKVTENNCMAHNNLGIALFGKEELDKAIFHYKKALNIKPDTSEAIKNLGVTLSEKGNFKEAAQYFSKALVINPEDWDSHYKLGGVLAKRGKFNEAICHFEEVIRINPGYAPVYNETGIIFAQKGKLQKSNNFFSKAIQLEPDCKEARDNLLILKQLMQQDEK